MIDNDTLLAYWRKIDDATGVPPTIREAQIALGISSPSVMDYHLRQLVKDGKLTHIANTAHAYRIPRKDHP